MRTRAERRTFVRLPWQIYPGRYPAWVPPLLAEERKRINPKVNPFFGHGAVELYLAYRDGRPQGRIAAIENRLHNEFHSDRVGFFGLFESTDDPEVATALLDSAANWVRGRKLDRLRGPTNFSTNEDCGLLVDSFEDPPYIMMTYNPPYYNDLFEGWGLAKVKDLIAYEISRDQVATSRLSGVRRLLERSGLEVEVRGIRMKSFDEEVGLVRDIYNSAWERNWGFVPMTDAEVDHMAKQLKPVINPALALIGEIDGEPAGFALALPDINRAIRHLNGRLFPFGIPKLLWHMRRIEHLRVITLGIRKQYRRTGLAALLYSELVSRGTAEGFTNGECSWILEDNHLMRGALEKLGCRHSKTYRLYERELQGHNDNHL